MSEHEQMTSEHLADVIAEYALDKKAHDVVTLDLTGLSGFTDAFVVCSGTSDRPPGARRGRASGGAQPCRAGPAASRGCPRI